MTPVSSDVQLGLLQKLATEFPVNLKGFTVTWEKGGMQAGLYTDTNGAHVFFNGAELDVLTLEDARDLLTRVFANQLVSVTGIREGSAVYCRLAPADDPAKTLPSPGLASVVLGQRTVPEVDDLVVESWLGGVEEKS
ncbi:MAG: hypothetical protein WAU68_16755 [Vitreimonas sp.]